MHVLNLKEYRGHGPSDTYIGRGSLAGNPFTMEHYRYDRNMVVALHKEYFLSQLANQSEMVKFVWNIPLENNVLCYCAPQACHGDFISGFRNETKGMDFKAARSFFLKKYEYAFLPQLEGITHINIYSKSLTDLGKLCSNFTYSPFEHPLFGKFDSMEGYWFYIGTGFQHEELRKLSGTKAKFLGSKFDKVPLDNFEALIEQGIRCKVDQNPLLKELLTINHLPFKHYYYYGDVDNCKVVREGNGLLENVFSDISRELGVSYKVIIAGSRGIHDIRWLTRLIVDSKYRISEIVEGGAKGVDTFGMYYAQANNIPHKPMIVTKEEWERSKGAGMARNRDMGNYADKAVIGILDNSKGSTYMAEYMKSLKKDAFVKHYA